MATLVLIHAKKVRSLAKWSDGLPVGLVLSSITHKGTIHLFCTISKNKKEFHFLLSLTNENSNL